MLLFSEIAHSLKKIISERNSSNVNHPQGFLNDFSFVEEMLNEERSEFEVSFLLLSPWNSLELLLLLNSFSFSFMMKCILLFLCIKAYFSFFF